MFLFKKIYIFFSTQLRVYLVKKGFYKKNKYDKSFLEGAILTLLSKRDGGKLLEIIQVGANDGINGDPLHNYLKRFGRYISILFVEPQITLKDVTSNFEKNEHILYIKIVYQYNLDGEKDAILLNFNKDNYAV